MGRPTLWKRWGAVSAALGLCLALAAHATADTFKPTRFNDPPPGKCKPDDCSLREAIGAANDRSGADTIRLAEGRYKLQIPPAGTDDNKSGELEVQGETTIRGKGPRETVIDGNGIDRVLYVFGNLTATLRSLTIREGDTGGDGGGILVSNVDKLTLNDVVLRKNEALRGGGLSSIGAELTISRSTIANNVGQESSGLDLRSGPAPATTTIRASTISGNTALKGTLAGKAGGILADGAPIPPLIPPTVSLINSTVAGNNADAEGGGIMADNGAAITLDNSTVAYNMSDADNTGGGNGGGIYRNSTAGTFTVGDALIASNAIGSTATGQQCTGGFTGAGGVVVQFQMGTSCAISGAINEPANALIGPLQHNGGPTKTIFLFGGSPAIGYAESCPATDQRGVERPAVDCDSGAFETDLLR